MLERVSQADASLLIRIVATGEVITDRFHFMSSGFGAYGIDRIVFSDGTIWTRETFQSKMIANGSGASDLLVGAGTDDTVNAGAGDDDVRGGAGNDVLSAKMATTRCSAARATIRFRVAMATIGFRAVLATTS